MDKEGTTVADYEYDPWGNATVESEKISGIKNQPIRYAGYVYDQATKLYYLQARYYDPATARFISKDPSLGDENHPFSQNAYSYAMSNPVMFTDPDGNLPILLVPILVNVGGRMVVRYVAKKGAQKVAKHVAYKTVKKSKVSKYKNVTKSSSRYANRATNVTKGGFERNLLNNGWKRSVSKDGKQPY